MSSPSLSANPLLSTWLDFATPGRVTAHMGKSELGQGVDTVMVQVVADTLGVDVARIDIQAPDTATGPDENFTAGSLSVPHSGTALLLAAANARQLFLAAAQRHLGSTDVTLEDGTFHSPSGSTTYWDLDVDTDVTVDPEIPLPPSSGTIGSSYARIDLEAKITGQPSYLSDVRWPNMAYGRVIRPAFRGAIGVDVDREEFLQRAGVVDIVVDGAFLAVIADTEIVAIKTAIDVADSAQWSGEPSDLTDDEVSGFLTTVETDDTLLAEGESVNPNGDAHSARYSRSFIAHASIGPATAMAHFDGTVLEVWSHTQGVYPLRRDLARALDIDKHNVRVRHFQGAGCYGHNPADDAAFDAAYLSLRVPNRPVHVTWTREDELGWGPFGPAMVVSISATTDDTGQITTWSWDGFGNGHSSRPSTLPTPSLLGYSHLADRPAIPPSGDPPLAAGAGTGRNSIPGYDIPSVRAVAHRALEMPMRASAMRSLGAHMNVFAIESHLDDLAEKHGIDPVEYRLHHLSDHRARAVIETVAAQSGWGTPVAEDRGRGIGYARYKGLGAWCAVVAEVEAIEEVRVTGLWIAVDCGRVINPDGVENQIEGGALQSLSWTLKERVRFSNGVVTSDTWEDYPILTFSEVPPVYTTIIDRPDEKWLGAGEASMGPTAAAIGNAIASALGIRVRDLPITSDAIVAAMGD